MLFRSGFLAVIAKRLTFLEERMCDMDNPITDAEMSEYGNLQTEFMHHDGYNLETNATTILTGLGFSDSRQQELVEHFSGGWKMRIAMAKILLQNPDLLLLDEPTNHLDLESIIFLESWLQNFKGSLIMTCHDREFMTRICNTTVELASGKVKT